MICEQYGGKIFIEWTQKDAGTKICMLLPVRVEESMIQEKNVLNNTSTFRSVGGGD